MMTNDIHDDNMDETLGKALRALPPEIEPERDLWPQIAAKIVLSRGQRQWAIAAVVAGLIAVGAIVATLTLQRHEAPPSFVVQPTLQSQPLPDAPALNARTKVIAATIRHNTRLDPQTQAVLLKNLVVIETSIVNIQQALNENPNTSGLQPLLYQLYRDEAALLTAAQRVQLQSTLGVALL